MAALFLMGADRVVPVTCGQDLDATVNADDPTIATRFQLEGPCTYTVDATMSLNEGDELAGPAGSFIERYPAFDPEPTVEVVGGPGVINVVAARGKVRLEWVKIAGGTGRYSGGSPVAGTGSALAMGMAADGSSLYAVHITGSDAAGITNARGTFDRIELDDTTQDPNFLGFTGSGLKATTEVEVRNSYIHDNQGNGLWCDVFCHDSADHPNGFWVHDNLVVDNGRAGIRFEQVGDVADSGEALIENNEVHQNSQEFTRGGIDIRDARDALVRNNVFGAKSIAGVAYRRNVSGLAIRATDSGRSDRPDLWNVDIGANVLNGETIVGCEKPDHIVDCHDTSSPKVSSVAPEDGAATGVAPDTNVEASFSEAMDASTMTEATFTLTLGGSDATPVAAAVSYDPTTRRATLNPNVALQAGKTYTARVKGGSAGVKDLAGNPLAADKVWSFTTPPLPPKDTTSPRGISASPKHTATRVAPSATLTASFSEKMDPASITNSTFNLFKITSSGATRVTNVTVGLSTDRLRATLNPFGSTTTHLSKGTAYKGVVTTGARDEAGNQLDQHPSTTGLQQKTWTFTVSN